MRTLLLPQPVGTPRKCSRRWKAFSCRCQSAKEDSEVEVSRASTSRRSTLRSLSGAAAAVLTSLAGQPLASAAVADVEASLGAAVQARMVLQAHKGQPTKRSGSGVRGDSMPITHKVYFDVGVCQSGVNTDRRLGDKTILCPNPESMGRLVIGLYGTVAPRTVEIFLETVRSGAYDYTLFSKVLPGEYVAAGRQGSHRMGYVELPPGLPANTDILSSSAFQLSHRRPGTVSLNLAGNEDDDYLRLGRDYRNTSFVITTGPGPVPRLDGENIVFGQVIEGLDVVSSVAGVPIFSPGSNLKAFNDFAKVLGDDRANKARATWGKPITPVLITKAGVLA